MKLACPVLAWALPVYSSLALPEDANQPIIGSYDNSMLLLDEGKQIYYGSAGSPAEINQGTLNISGQEITIERVDGEVKKITVTGSPARYQQQPAIDQAMVIAEGATIILDYDEQQLSADGEVKFTQGSDVWSGCHIDYYIESKRLTTPLCEDGERANAIISPRKDQ